MFMHDKVYNRLSTESNIRSKKICMTKLVFLKCFVPPATPLPPPALEMNTQHAGVTLIRSVAKLKLLKFDARTLYFERALYFAKLDLVSTEVFVRVLAHFVKLYASFVLVNSLRDGYGCFVSCGFLVHCYQTSLLTTLLPDNTRTAFES